MKRKVNRWMGAIGTAMLAGAAGWFIGTSAGMGLAYGKEIPGKIQAQGLPVDGMSNASPEYFEFSSVQNACVRTIVTAFGQGGTWRSCRLESAGFVGTMAVPGSGLQDFYYASYCLVRSGQRCDRQALLVFSNRAYRPEAVLRLARLDPAGTRYTAPLLIGTAKESALALTIQPPGSAAQQRQYFGWRGSRWVGIEPDAWRARLGEWLPKGTFARVPDGTMPDPETLELRVPVYRADAAVCCDKAGSAEVRFAIEEGHLAIASVQMASAEAR